ncbi:hypothetical protein JCM11251_007231 [Rhodosporidiobolus azoricus]
MSARLPAASNTDHCSYQIHFPPSQAETDTLTSLLPQVTAFIASLSRSYIWHNPPTPTVSLSPLSFSTPANQQHYRWIQGKHDVTDAVDDEWFLVWMLKRLTEQWDNAAVLVEDDDGEFLLIEAAEVLPSWVTPQNAANRVWIYRGHLHLIPLTHRSSLPFPSGGSETLNPSFDADEEGFLDRATALELVRDEKVETRSSKEVEEAVWARIAGYPAKAEEHHHRTLAYLPTDIALALSDSPELVAEAIKAFYEREPATLKACNTMTRFPPSSPSSAFSPAPSTADSSEPPSSDSLPPTVLTPVRLTRPLYSQLVLQRFWAPKVWEKAGWGVKENVTGEAGEGEERRKGVGMKIACGFEMLYALTRAQLLHPTSSSSDSATSSDPAYKSFLTSLTAKGFFEGEVEGSEKWKRLEEGATQGWEKAKQGERPTLSFAQRVDDAIARARSATAPPLSDRLTRPASNLAASDLQKLEDSEEWMALDEQGLEELLASREGGRGKGGFGGLGDSDLEDSSDEGEGEDESAGGGEVGAGAEGSKEEQKRAKKAAKRLEDMAARVEEFVEGRGAVQGAVFDDERSDGDEEEDEDEQMPPPPLSAEERASRMEKLVAPLAAEDWGQSTSTTAPPPLDLKDEEKKQDGEVDSRDLPMKPRPSALTEEKYDGASEGEDDASSVASSNDDGAMAVDGLDEEGEDAPAILGGEDGELDMGEEMDEFLRFATETLGLTKEQYEGILGERRDRGAFVPGPAKEKKTNVLPKKSSTSASSSSSKPAPTLSPAAQTAAGNPPPPPAHAQQLRNPNLADFDSLMEQMEKELALAKGAAGAGGKGKKAETAAKGKGKEAQEQGRVDEEMEPKRTPYGFPSSAPDGPAPKSGSKAGAGAAKKTRFVDADRAVVESLSDSDNDEDEDDDGELSAMDAELANLLQGGADGEGGMDYNLVKNFLESFQAQGGFGGPAGNMAGRMGFQLPRDA